MKLIDIILKETVVYDETVINNQRFKSQYSARTDSFEEFAQLILKLPDSIQSLKVQTGTDSNEPQQDSEVVRLSPKKDSMWREKAIEHLKKTVQAIEKAGQEPIEYIVRSYGTKGPKEADGAFYTQIKTRKSIQKAKDIASMGSLDEDAIEDTHKTNQKKVIKFLKQNPDHPHKSFLVQYLKIKDPIEANTYWINHIKKLPIRF